MASDNPPLSTAVDNHGSPSNFHYDRGELENFLLIVAESDESDDSTVTEEFRDRSPIARSSKRNHDGRLFCDHCNRWVAKSTFYRHKNERKRESDEDSTGDSYITRNFE